MDDETVSADVLAKLWPDPDSRPERAWRCHRCQLIYTLPALHADTCPELTRVTFFQPVTLPFDTRSISRN